jgi:hypothetical protein
MLGHVIFRRESYLRRMTPNLENDKLQFGDIIWMHPILGRLTNKVLLTTSCGTIAFDWVSPRPDLVVELG